MRILIIISLLTLSLNSFSQHNIGDSRLVTIVDIVTNTSNDSILITKDLVYYKVNIETYKVESIKYFKEDTCYKFISTSSLNNYEFEKELLKLNFGYLLSSKKDIWYKLENNKHIVVEIVKLKDSINVILIGFDSYQICLNYIESKIK